MRIRTLLAALSAGLLGHAAFADEAKPCPDSAVEQLYNLQVGLLNGTMTDPNAAYQVVRDAMARCEGNSTVQGLSASIAAILANALSDQAPEVRQTLLETAYAAALAEDDAFSLSAPAPKLTLADGSETSVYTWGQTDNLLKTIILPQLLELELMGRPQDIFSLAPVETCPFPRDQARARTEAEGLTGAVIANFSRGEMKDVTGFSRAMGRLEKLREVCKQQEPVITWQIAWAHEQRLNRLSEYLSYGYYADVLWTVQQEAESLASTARKHYNAFATMPVTDSRDEANNQNVHNRLMAIEITAKSIAERSS